MAYDVTTKRTASTHAKRAPAAAKPKAKAKTPASGKAGAAWAPTATVTKSDLKAAKGLKQALMDQLKLRIALPETPEGKRPAYDEKSGLWTAPDGTKLFKMTLSHPENPNPQMGLVDPSTNSFYTFRTLPEVPQGAKGSVYMTGPNKMMQTPFTEGKKFSDGQLAQLGATANGLVQHAR